MRRLLLLLAVLLVTVLAIAFVARGGSDSSGPDGGRLTAETMPFPRSTTPLPVPEVRIGELPWRDEVAPEATRAPGERVCKLVRIDPRSPDSLKPPLQCPGD